MPPAQAPLEPAEEAAGAASINSTLLVVAGAPALLIAFLIGVLVGARASQITAKLRAMGRAILSLRVLFREVTTMAGMEEAEAVAGDDDKEGEDDEEETLKGKDGNILDEFMDLEETVEDHPDLDINPVIIYHMKVVGVGCHLLPHAAAVAHGDFKERPPAL